MPSTLKNSREINLATITADKKSADEIYNDGELSFGHYYSKQERDECIVCADEDHRLRYKISQDKIPPGSHMYVVLPSGDLCIDDLLTHSQFNAGGPIQSGGHIIIAEDGTISQIDNFSGHYQPTLSQFLSTIVGLHRAGLLNAEIMIKLNGQTRLDYKFSIDYFSQLKDNQIARIEFRPSGNVLIKIDDRHILLTDEMKLCKLSGASRYSFLHNMEKKRFHVSAVSDAVSNLLW